MTYDKESDSLYIKFSNEKIEESEEYERAAFIFDFDKNNLVGIEILNASAKLKKRIFGNLQ